MSSITGFLDPVRLSDLASDPMYSPVRRVPERIPYKTPGLSEVLTALVEALAQIEGTAHGAFGPCGLSREAWMANWVADDPESYSTWQRLSNVAGCASK